MSKKSAIIVAGGKGNRMKSELPKQFLSLNGLPVLMLTLRVFHNYDPEIQLILVLPSDSIAVWKELCEKHNFQIEHEICEGGPDRTSSVRNGLAKIGYEDLVAIHDGVRPLVDSKTIHDSYFYAEKWGNAIAAVKSKDSLRVINSGISSAVDRESYRIIQTPQTFKGELIKKAYEIVQPKDISDDAAVLEKYGEKINLIEGSYENIKITTPEDLELAEMILRRRQKK